MNMSTQAIKAIDTTKTVTACGMTMIRIGFHNMDYIHTVTNNLVLQTHVNSEISQRVCFKNKYVIFLAGTMFRSIIL